MGVELKESLQKAHDRMVQLVDKLEMEFETLSAESKDIWVKTKPKLQQMQASLKSAAQSMHEQADEARLQAHLAAMDAHDQWQYLSKIVSELVRHGAEKGAHQLQHADLQAHLAAMETRDFIKSHGPGIRKDFQEAKEKVEKASRAIAQELEASLEKLGDMWSKFK